MAEGERRVDKHASGGGRGERGATAATYDHLIVLDFEATCWNDGDPAADKANQEIIEFPSAVVCLKTLQIIERLEQFVRPTTHPTLSDFCKHGNGGNFSGTTITQEQVDAADTLDIALARHMQLVSKYPNSILVTCGDWDLKTMLPLDLSNKKLGGIPEYYTRWINLKHAFLSVTGVSVSGMPGMVSRYGLALEGVHHRGIDDCVNIARLAIEMIRQNGWVPRATWVPKTSKEAAQKPSNLDGRSGGGGGGGGGGQVVGGGGGLKSDSKGKSKEATPITTTDIFMSTRSSTRNNTLASATIATLANTTTAKTKIKNEHPADDGGKRIDKACEKVAETTDTRKTAKPSLPRPNFFVALKLADSPDIVQAIENIQREMATRGRAASASWIRNSFTPAGKAHFTFNVLCVDDKRKGDYGVLDIQTAMKIFADTQELVHSCICDHLAAENSSTLPRLEFGQLGSFGENVVFLKPLETSAYTLMHKMQGIVSRAFYDTINTESSCGGGGGGGDKGAGWQAHVTVAKTSKMTNKGHGAPQMSLKREFYEGLDRLLDKVVCEMVTIDLLDMRETDEKGYYKSYASYNLGDILASKKKR